MRSFEELHDKVVLVTGAGRGLGRALAEAFAAQGAIVAANDLSPVNLDETVRRIQASGGRVRDYIFDIAKKMPIQSLVEQVASEWGRIDILVNSASVAPRAAVLDMDEWDWHRTIDVNLGGPFFTMQVVGRLMRAQDGGAMVNIAADVDGAGELEQLSAFVASQAGLIALTRAAASELAADNIRVNAVCPKMRLLACLAAASVGDQENLPQELIAHVQTITQTVLYLCSQQAAQINGQVMAFDDNLQIRNST